MAKEFKKRAGQSRRILRHNSLILMKKIKKPEDSLAKRVVQVLEAVRWIDN
jgi:hypothetical protein